MFEQPDCQWGNGNVSYNCLGLTEKEPRGETEPSMHHLAMLSSRRSDKWMANTWAIDITCTCSTCRANDGPHATHRITKAGHYVWPLTGYSGWWWIYLLTRSLRVSLPMLRRDFFTYRRDFTVRRMTESARVGVLGGITVICKIMPPEVLNNQALTHHSLS